MKNNILNILVLLALTLFISSCSENDANEAVQDSIKKLELFNKQFDIYYQDGVISKELADGNKQSEYAHLKKIASEYYELINGINDLIKEERKDLEDGKSVEGFEQAYKDALKKHENAIKNATDAFSKNLSKL